MSRNKNEDFTLAIKRQLRERVANYCSNPNCRVLTISTKESNSTSIHIIGEGAHICAVQPNGARYDIKMTSAQRKSFDNGIWLCRNCHKIIDSEPEKYSVKLLKEWKKDAEEYSVENIGKRPKTDIDIQEAQRNLLSAMPLNSISNAIDNVHKSVKQSLENLDPRFSVIPSYQNGQTYYTIQPKVKEERLKLSIDIDHNYTNNLEFEELFKHGKSISLNNITSINTDSALFNHIFNVGTSRPNEIFISPNKILKGHILFSTDDESFVGENIQKLDGDISFGSETFSFLGSIKGVVNFSFNKIPLNPLTQSGKYSAFLTFNFESRENKQLRSLDGIDEVFNFFKLIRNDDLLISFFINDIRIASLSTDLFKNASSNSNFLYISYLYKSYKICKLLNLPALLPKDCIIDFEEYKNISKVYADLFEKRIVSYEEMSKNGVITFCVCDENFHILQKFLENPQGEYSFEITHEFSTILIFNKEFNLPPSKVLLENFSIRSDKVLLKLGEDIKLELIPNMQSLYKTRYKLH